MRWAPALLGRPILVLAVLAALACPSAATLWVSTPGATDIQSRVQASTARDGVPLLREDDVPKQLAEAVVAIEDERF